MALCALIPVLAGAIAFAAVRDEPVRHRTLVSLPLPATVASGSASLVAQWVAGFRQAATGPDAIAAVVEATDLAPAVVADAVRARQDGEGPFVEVVFLSTTEAAGEPAVETIVAVAIERMASPQRQEVDARQLDLDVRSRTSFEARAALDEFVLRTGELQPAESLRARETTLTAQRFQLSVEEEISTLRALGIRDAIADLEVEIAALRPLVAEHDALTRAVDDTGRSLDAAEDALAEATAALDSALAPEPLAPPVTAEVPPGPTVRRAVLMASGLGLLVASGLLLLRGFLGAPAPFAARLHPTDAWPDDRRLHWWRQLTLPVTTTTASDDATAMDEDDDGGGGFDDGHRPSRSDEGAANGAERWGAPVWVVGDDGTDMGWQRPGRRRTEAADGALDDEQAGTAAPVSLWMTRRSRALDARTRARARSRTR